MKLLGLGLTFPLLSFLSSCTTDAASPGRSGENLLTVDGKLEHAPDESSEVVLGWDVNDGDPDYVYVWGRADVQQAAFSLQLKTRPPVEALTKYGLGVARLLSVAKSAHAREGKLQGDAFATSINGASRMAVVYVDLDMAHAALNSSNPPLTADELETARQHWLFDFPPGYSCAEGRDAHPGETFDSFVPMDCTKLEISAGTDVPFPNWT